MKKTFGLLLLVSAFCVGGANALFGEITKEATGKEEEEFYSVYVYEDESLALINSLDDAIDVQKQSLTDALELGSNIENPYGQAPLCEIDLIEDFLISLRIFASGENRAGGGNIVESANFALRNSPVLQNYFSDANFIVRGSDGILKVDCSSVDEESIPTLEKIMGSLCAAKGLDLEQFKVKEDEGMTE